MGFTCIVTLIITKSCISFNVHCYFFPQVEVLPDCMKDVFDDSVHLLFNHSFLSFHFLHITVLNYLTYSIFFI